MAFTEAEKTRIRMLTGWGSRFTLTETRLENAMDAVGGIAEDQAKIQAILTSLTTIDTQITSALETAGVTGVSSIKLDSDQGISHFKAEGRRLVEAIASILQVPIKKNYYGGGMTGSYIPYG